MSGKPYVKPTGPPSTSEREPFSGERLVHGAVPALVCAHCGSAIAPGAVIDIIEVGTTLTARSLRGRAALLLCATGVDDLIVDAAVERQRMIDAFDEMGLTCARYAEEL